MGYRHGTYPTGTGNGERDITEGVLLGSEQELQVSQSELSELGEDTAEEIVTSLAQSATCRRDQAVPAETCQSGID